MNEEKKRDSKQVATGPELIQGSSDVTEVVHELADEALGFVEKHEGFMFTAKQDKAVLRKIDLHIMPLVIIPYFHCNK